jgi:hypothetical protein
MDQRTKLHLALIQIHNLTELLKDNEYKVMMYAHLISIRVELQRQLSHLTNTSVSTTIQE